ncbi:septal ring lytic transglycosylase RlpA family protein [Luteimonas sp. BDR2-5]|uniref:septal ring lytic transglycosylase RlpA family protein n=1 Tax=Proluteimonas luteida TaxID=2878685 RepID=UPI001E4BF4E5|nr:septal ring lytic transglycosylase RlpA family protein [Luteimonas sp. BDR2-5]MCD9027188.1 septal ring lytic transglycosylase RlpA family protein [Luteimonas sp. BDR2-5]
MRWLLPLAAVVLLAGCAGTQKKSDGTAATRVAAPAAAGTAHAPGTRRVSPYPPAQEDPSTRGHYTAGGLYRPGVPDSLPDYLPNVDLIPEPEVVDLPRSPVGNRSPYRVLGKEYHVLDDHSEFVETGTASYYGAKFHGRRTSNQEVYDMYAFTAAHKSLPLPSFARVTNLDTGQSVIVRVNDRGPFHEGRVVDLSYAAAVKIGVHPAGTGRVEVRALSPGEDARHGYDAVAATPAPAPDVVPVPASQVATAPASRRAARRNTRAAVATAPAAAPPAAPAAASGTATVIDAIVEALPIASAQAGERPAPSPAPHAGDGRFNMYQDGRVMTADDFDAWLAARGLRLENGRQVPIHPAPETPVAAAAPTASTPAAPSPPAAVAAPAPAPAASAGVTLQVAAFGARANAERALAQLRGAGIAGAALHGGQAAGKPVWRLRVGPLDAARVAEMSSRVAGLGFGAPTVVRD